MDVIHIIIYLRFIRMRPIARMQMSACVAYAQIHSQTDLLFLPLRTYFFFSAFQNVIRSTEVCVGLFHIRLSCYFFFFFVLSVCDHSVYSFSMDSHCVCEMWMQKNEHMLMLIRIQTECIVTEKSHNSFIRIQFSLKSSEIWDEQDFADGTFPLIGISPEFSTHLVIVYSHFSLKHHIRRDSHYLYWLVGAAGSVANYKLLRWLHVGRALNFLFGAHILTQTSTRFGHAQMTNTFRSSQFPHPHHRPRLPSFVFLLQRSRVWCVCRSTEVCNRQMHRRCQDLM